MERMGRVMKDLAEHTQCCKLIVRFGIKNLQARRLLFCSKTINDSSILFVPCEI